MNVYEFILSKSFLSDKHKAELKEKRGFTPETIKALRFVSSGEHMLDLEPELIKNFTKEELTASGVFIENDGKLSISPMLLKENIIIPYLNKSGSCHLLRPHKFGLKNVAIDYYHEFAIRDRNLIITEGEFKAAAAWQLGYSCIGLPGIASFSDKNFPRLVKMLNDEKIRSICIIFDNEVKDDPVFKERFKAEPSNRYDTQFYAYYMATILDKEGFDARVGTLPDGWRVDGKADIDGAVAMGKTKEDFDNIIKTSFSARNYLDQLPSEAKAVIARKLAQKYFRSHIRKEFNRYIAIRQRGKHMIDEKISNFIINVIATHDTPEGIMREVRFINEFNEYSSSFVINGAQMTGKDAFREFCITKGNFVWSGQASDLDVIWESEFLNDSGLRIYEPDHVGFLQKENAWLFGNVCFKDGKEYRPDDSQTFWVDKKGIRPSALGVSSGKEAISEGLPYLNTKAFDLNLIKENFELINGKRKAHITLGWTSAVPYMEEIYAEYGSFPFLFAAGKRGSGKSTYSEWVMNMFGMENSGKQASGTTSVAIQRLLGYYSSLPVFIDEYRNTKEIVYKNGLFRNAYNRQFAGKGIKSDFGIRMAKIRGTILFAGEDAPDDNALLSRCIVVKIVESDRIDNPMEWFMANRSNLSAYTYHVIKNKPAMVKDFMGILKNAKDYLVKKGIDERTAINHATVGAGYQIMFNDDESIVDDVFVQATQSKEENEEEQMVKVFLDDLVYLKTIGKVDKRFWCVESGMAYLYFHGLYNVWCENYRKTRAVEAFKASTLRDYLKQEPGYVDCNVNKWMESGTKRCTVFDVEKSEQAIKSLVDLGQTRT